MRADEVDLLIVPGWANSDPDHWQSRWEGRLKTARRVIMPDFDRPALADWVDALVAATQAATRPVVFVAHSCGVLAVAQAAPQFRRSVIGAMLVAPPDLGDNPHVGAFLRRAGSGVAAPVGFDEAPKERLPFPSLVIASRNDPFCAFARAEEMARDWGSAFVDAGEAGHLNAEAGYGPWPEGALRLASFLKSLAPEIKTVH